jgi:hypothetical protein
MPLRKKNNKTKVPIIGRILMMTGIFYSVLVLMLFIVGMDEYLFGKAQWSPDGYFIGFIVAMFGAIPILICRNRFVTPSMLFILLQFVFVYLPSCALISVYSMFPVWFVVSMGLYLILFAMLVGPTVHNLSLKISLPIKIILGAPLISWVLFGLVTFIVAIFAAKNFTLTAFNLDTLYDFRAQVFSEFSGVELTALSGLGYFLFPAMMIFAIYKLSLLYAIFVVVMSFLLFGITGIKTYLVIGLFAGVIYKASQSYDLSNCYLKVLFGALIGLLVAYIVGYIFDTPWPMALLFNRGVMTPGFLHLIYAWHFSEMEHLYFWEIFSAKPSSWNELNIAQIIAVEVYKTPVDSGEGANTGLLAAAYAAYGVGGFIFHGFFAFLILVVLDITLKNDKSNWTAYTSIPAIFLLTNIDIISVFLYYGLGFSVVLATLFQAKKLNSEKSKNIK